MRRIIVHASEDVGLADPLVMLQAQAAANALEWIGLPEARIPMAQAVIAIATALKAIRLSRRSIGRRNMCAPIKRPSPSAPAGLPYYPGAKNLGHGTGYRYPHSYPGNWVEQDYLLRKSKGFNSTLPAGREWIKTQREK
jgi:putative ATPase